MTKPLADTGCVPAAAAEAAEFADFEFVDVACAASAAEGAVECCFLRLEPAAVAEVFEFE